MTHFNDYPSYYTQLGNVKLHYKLVGSEDAPLVLLLHGFPEFSYGWRHQVPALLDAGFRVAIPDQRGYNLSDKPKGVKNYDLALLAGDMIALADHLEADKFYLAGHDWGAAVAWRLAMEYPQRIAKLAILNVPHPAVMVKTILSVPEQRRKSWYMFFFQLPWLPEVMLRMQRHKNAVRLLKGSGQKGTFTQEDIEVYRQAWGQPRAWTGMIHWYRAMFRRMRSSKPGGKVQPPTRIIWGKKDAALMSQMAEDSLAFCEQGELYFLPNATHWVQHDEPEQVNHYLITFFLDK